MKNHFDKSITFKPVLIISLLLIIMVLITLQGISCQPQMPESAPTVPSPGLPKEPSSAEPPAAPPQIEVAIDGFAFKPADITVPAGTAVVWYNNDSVIHTATARDGSFDSGSLSKGDTFSHTFEAKGSFEYYCIPHPYMTGVIIVE